MSKLRVSSFWDLWINCGFVGAAIGGCVGGYFGYRESNCKICTPFTVAIGTSLGAFVGFISVFTIPCEYATKKICEAAENCKK